MSTLSAESPSRDRAARRRRACRTPSPCPAISSSVGPGAARLLVCPQVFDETLELGARRHVGLVGRPRRLDGQEQRIGDPRRIAVRARVVQERQRAVGHRELAEVDVVLDVVAEVAPAVPRSGCTAVRCRSRSAPGRRDSRRRCRSRPRSAPAAAASDPAVAVPAIWLVQPTAHDQQGRRHHHRRAGNSHVNRPSLCARIPAPGQPDVRWLSARELCVSYALMQPCRQPLMPRILVCALRSSQSPSSRMSTASPTRCFG